MGGSTHAVGLASAVRRAYAAYPRKTPEPNGRQAPRRQARMFTGIVAELGEVAGIEHRGDAARLTIRGDTEGVITGGVDRGQRRMPDRHRRPRRHVHRGRHGRDPRPDRAWARSPRARRSTWSARSASPTAWAATSSRATWTRTGTIISRSPKAHWDQVRISLPASIGSYVVHKGSICVDGVSLTVSALGPDGPDPKEGTWFEVSLIPETLKRTTLGTAPAGRDGEPGGRRHR